MNLETGRVLNQEQGWNLQAGRGAAESGDL